MLLDKASSVNIGSAGVSFLGEFGEVLSSTSFENLQGMVAGYTTYGECNNNCPFCKGRPDISIPGFLEYDEKQKKPIFKLIIDRRRTIIKKLVSTISKLKANPTHILYITAVPLDNPLNTNRSIIPSAVYHTYVEKGNIGYLFQITSNNNPI